MSAQRVIAMMIATLLLSASSRNVCTAQVSEGTRHSVERAMTLVRDGKPLAGLTILEQDSEKTDELQSIIPEMRTFVGDWQGAHRAMDDSSSKPSKDKASFLEPVIPIPALDAIVEQAKNHRIVILNEAHHVPQHRAFILQVLRKLRSQGFEYYAAEALNEDSAALNKRGYAIRTTGFYTNEPVFGAVVHDALAMGFKLIAYEATGNTSTSDPVTDINVRETKQCSNLMERLFAKNSDARVVIHVGYHHAMERPVKRDDGREILWMASRLAQATGINPLTIDQTIHTEKGDTSSATPQWQEAVKNGWLDQPIVLKRKDDNFHVTGDFANQVDIQVFHPPTKLIDGRPDWLVDDPGRVPVSIPDDIRAESARLLVQALIEDQSEDAIPFDLLVLMPGEPRPKLLLKPGKYRIIAQDEQGRGIARQSLSVGS
jgi:hypothetical protein